MPNSGTAPLNVLSIKGFSDLQDYLDKKSDQIEISKSIIIPADIAQNQRKQTYRRHILSAFENKQLFLSSIKENRNSSKGEAEFTLVFAWKKPNHIIFEDAQESEPYRLNYVPDMFVELGLRQFMISSEIQTIDFKDKHLVPLNSIVEKMWNGGAMIGKKTDPSEPCASAATINQYPFIFKGTEMSEHHLRIVPKFKCDKDMILVSACRMTKEEVGIPCLVVDTDKPFNATNTVIAVKLKPEFANMGYLARLTKFMFSQEFRKQLYPQRHDKSLMLSIKNLRVTMVPDPAMSNPEDKILVKAIEELRLADQKWKERLRECERLFRTVV